MTGRLLVGIDAGSSATKCVLLWRETAAGAATARVAGHAVVPSGFDYAEAARSALGQALGAAGAGVEDIASCVATGYGRGSVELPGSVSLRRLTEITCHARGARAWYPDVRHVIDIGGQDTKVIRLSSDGRMADYRMNAKCAAGTGTFLESIAVRLALPLSEVDRLAMSSTSRLTLNSYCTVFTSTEVLERIKAGDAREDIAMGMFRAIASRVVEMLSTGGTGGAVAATGGVVTHCRAMIAALEEALECPVRLPPMPQHAGAYGAALLAGERSDPALPAWDEGRAGAAPSAAACDGCSCQPSTQSRHSRALDGGRPC